jgi:thiol:disulfide interchange protein
MRLTKTNLVLLAILAFIGWKFFTHPHTTFAVDGTDPAWDAAVARSRSAHRPTIILFTADWCPACRALHQGGLARTDIAAELLSHYSLYSVDLTNPGPQAREHARQYGARYIPLLIRYDADGNETARTNYLPPDKLLEWVKAGE